MQLDVGFPSPLFNTSRLCPEKQSDHRSQVPLDSTSPCMEQPPPTPLESQGSCNFNEPHGARCMTLTHDLAYFLARLSKVCSISPLCWLCTLRPFLPAEILALSLWSLQEPPLFPKSLAERGPWSGSLRILWLPLCIYLKARVCWVEGGVATGAGD